MNGTSKDFHEATKLDDMKIVARNFNFELDKILVPIKPKGLKMAVDSKVIIDGEFTLIVKIISIFVLGENNNALAELRIKFTFSVKNDCKYITDYHDHFELSPGFSKWLDHIILGTSRGIIYTEFRGTYLDGIILPLTDPSELENS